MPIPSKRFSTGWQLVLPSHTVTRLSAPVGEYLLLTLAAQIPVILVMAYHFQSLSLTMLIANPLILPVQPAVMILGGLATLGGMIFRPFGQLMAYVAWPFTAKTIRVVELVGKVSGGVVYLGSLSLGFVIAYYPLLFLATFSWAKISGWIQSRLKAVGLAVPLAALFVAAILV